MRGQKGDIQEGESGVVGGGGWCRRMEVSVVTRCLAWASRWSVMPLIHGTETRRRDNMQAGTRTISFYFLYSDAFTLGP